MGGYKDVILFTKLLLLIFLGTFWTCVPAAVWWVSDYQQLPRRHYFDLGFLKCASQCPEWDPLSLQNIHIHLQITVCTFTLFWWALACADECVFLREKVAIRILDAMTSGLLAASTFTEFICKPGSLQPCPNKATFEILPVVSYLYWQMKNMILFFFFFKVLFSVLLPRSYQLSISKLCSFILGC